MYRATILRPQGRRGDVEFVATNEDELEAKITRFVEGEAPWVLDPRYYPEFRRRLEAGEDPVTYFFERAPHHTLRRERD